MSPRPGGRSPPSRSACTGRARARAGTGAGRRPRAPRRPASRGVVRYGTGWAATGMSTAARIAASSGSIVAGPREQLRPTTAAPASASRPARLDVVVAVVGRRRLHARERDHRGQAELLADLEPDQRLADVVVGLRDHEVDALLDRPAELLLVLRADHRARPLRLGRVVGPGVADVAGHERAALGGDLVRDPHRLAVQLLEVVPAADRLAACPGARSRSARPSRPSRRAGTRGAAAGARRARRGSPPGTNGPALM